MSLPIYFNRTYTEVENNSETTVKSGVIADSFSADPIDGALLTDPSGFTDEADRLIRIVHTREYVEAVRTGEPHDLAITNGLTWCPNLHAMTVAHSSGLVAATHHALSTGGTAGSLSSGLHHARADRGMGFCTFNGLAIAACAALELGARRVLIVDVDAHCGGGTYSIIKDNPAIVQVDVSTSFTYDRFPATGDHRRIPAHSRDYLERITEGLEYASGLRGVDFVIANMGMDPINDGVAVDDMEVRERLVRDFIGSTPAIFAIAGGYKWGGYSIDDVAAWHRMTIKEWASR
ncbi:MAG: Rhodococcus phage [Actinomycetota bacterium]|jgi:acetoin utilization deacetylase AcuC-like enzyme